jgi:outer membrane lipoprotein-sorting protein
VSNNQGFVRNITVTSADHDSFVLGWTAPTTVGCYAQRALWDTDWATTWSLANAANITDWVQDASASQTQGVTFSTLAAESEYAYRIACAKPGWGRMTTAGAP